MSSSNHHPAGNNNNGTLRCHPHAQHSASTSAVSAPTPTISTPVMINPHNPDFITKKPWYLNEGGSISGNISDSGMGSGSGMLSSGGAGGIDQGPTIDHQKRGVMWGTRMIDTSLEASDRVLRDQRKREKERLAVGKLVQGMWVEALKHNKPPYRMCQILKVHKDSNSRDGNHKYDLQYEDGTIERQVRRNHSTTTAVDAEDRPTLSRIRITKSGNRSATNTAGIESWDSKRDKYHGYDREHHNAKLSAKYEERELIRSQLRQEQQQQQQQQLHQNQNQQQITDKEPDSDSIEGGGDDQVLDDEFVQRDEQDKVITTRLARQGGVGGAQMKVTARNLRIREDTAKYLHNLNLDSAYYDPKSRSMRDNPNPEVPLQAAEFAGDNFTRISGDAVGLAEAQLFAWEASKKGVDVHMQANPSLAEKAKKQFQTKSSDLQLMRKKAVLDKYGGEEYLDGKSGLASAVEGNTRHDQVSIAHLPFVDKMLRFGESTTVQDHSQFSNRNVSSIGKKQYVPIESQYEEDIFINGHTSVWGSYFHKGAFQWGYEDDHSLMKKSYCTGENGRIANDEAHEMRFGTGKAGSAALAKARGLLKSREGRIDTLFNQQRPGWMSQSKLYGETDPSIELDPEKVKTAISQLATNINIESSFSSKRKYHSMEAEVQYTEEDMEAYRLLKERKNDPMANLGGDTKLLDY